MYIFKLDDVKLMSPPKENPQVVLILMNISFFVLIVLLLCGVMYEKLFLLC